MFFYSFSKFWFFGGVSGGKRQKIDMTKNDKKLCLGQAPYLRNHTSCDCYLWYLQGFFHFFKCLIFWGVRGRGGSKRTKNVSKWEKNCLSHSISQEPYIIWLSFVVHKCKMITSPGFLFIFSKFWLFRLLGGS